MEIVKKAGAWFTYEGDQLGQGRENARQFLVEHQDIALDLERKVREAVGLTAFTEGGDVAVEIVPDLVLDGEAEAEGAGAPAQAKKTKEREPSGASAG
jgi:recombination protein RecA